MRYRAPVLLLVALSLLFAATAIRSGWLYLVSSVLISLVAAAFFEVRRNIRGLVLRRECPGEVVEKEPFQVRLKVGNPRGTGRYFLEFEDATFARTGERGLMAGKSRRRQELKEMRLGRTAGAANPTRVAVRGIARRSSVDLTYSQSAPARGVYDSSRLIVSTGGFFGLTRDSLEASAPSPTVVFPEVHPIAYFPFEAATTEPIFERTDWSRKGGGQEYYGVREYVRGDSLRHVHWKSSARIGQLIVREYQREYRSMAGLVVLLFEPAFGDARSNSVEDGLRCASSILNYYQVMGGMPRLTVPVDGAVEVLVDASFNENMRALASYEAPGGRLQDTSSALAEALALAGEATAPGSALALVTNAVSGQIAAALEESRTGNSTSVVAVVDGSYGPDWDTGRSLLELEELIEALPGGVHLYMMTRGQEIGRCLSAPHDTTRP